MKCLTVLLDFLSHRIASLIWMLDCVFDRDTVIVFVLKRDAW